MSEKVVKIFHQSEVMAENAVNKINGLGNGISARIVGRGGDLGTIIEVPYLNGSGPNGTTTREKIVRAHEACVVVYESTPESSENS